MRDVLVCYAVKEEVGPRVRRMARCAVLVTGMGERNAREKASAMLARMDCRLVLTCGFAGALDPELKCGTVLCDHDAELDISNKLAGVGAVSGRFHCSRRVAVTAQEKFNLRRTTAADAVEMESGIIRELCRKRRIASATVRVILDEAAEDLPLDFNAVMTGRQDIHFGKLIGRIIARPERVFALLRFQRTARDAAEELDRVLERMLHEVFLLTDG